MLPREWAISTLVITMILLFFTVIMGLVFGAGLIERVSDFMEIQEGEIIRANAFCYAGMVTVLVDFKHVLGSDFDRVVVSELVIGDTIITLNRLGNDVTFDYNNLQYSQEGWEDGSGIQCSDVLTSTSNCKIKQSMIGLPLSDGNTATLNFTIHDVNDYRETFQDEAAGIILEYGSVDETVITSDASVSVQCVAP